MKYSEDLTSSQRRKILTLLLCCLAAAGAVAGSVYSAAKGGALPVRIHQYFLPETGSAVLRTMLHTMLSSAVFIAIAYFFGLSAFGQPLGIALIVYRGFGIGAASAALYSAYGSGAVLKVLALLLPKALAVTLVSVLAVRELMRASQCVLRFWTYGGIPDERSADLRRYSLKFAVLMLISLLISLADGAVFALYCHFS
jgi:hypothetical protein